MSDVKNQHYVWRYYLKSWTEDDKIWCRRLGKTYNTNLKNIGSETYFYEISILNPIEEKFIRWFCKNEARDQFSDIVNNIIDCFMIPSKLDYLLKQGISIDNLLYRDAKINLHERMLGTIENASINYIEKLKIGDYSFLNDEISRSTFIYYLCFQYTRTKKMKYNHSLINFKKYEILNTDSISMDKVWGIISIIYAIWIGAGIIGFKKRFHYKLIRNNSCVRYITGDQPVINLASIGVPIGHEIEELEFYHPISPNIGIYFSSFLTTDTIKTVDNPDTIRDTNNQIFEVSHEQIYAKNKIDVEIN